MPNIQSSLDIEACCPQNDIKVVSQMYVSIFGLQYWREKIYNLQYSFIYILQLLVLV